MYITAETCMKFCQVKKANGLASDERTLKYRACCFAWAFPPLMRIVTHTVQ